jgi:hypothetical protein
VKELLARRHEQRARRRSARDVARGGADHQLEARHRDVRRRAQHDELPLARAAAGLGPDRLGIAVGERRDGPILGARGARGAQQTRRGKRLRLTLREQAGRGGAGGPQLVAHEGAAERHGDRIEGARSEQRGAAAQRDVGAPLSHDEARAAVARLFEQHVLAALLRLLAPRAEPAGPEHEGRAVAAREGGGQQQRPGGPALGYIDADRPAFSLQLEHPRARRREVLRQALGRVQLHRRRLLPGLVRAAHAGCEPRLVDAELEAELLRGGLGAQGLGVREAGSGGDSERGGEGEVAGHTRGSVGRVASG